MCILTENQVRVLKLFYKGMRKSEITKMTGLSNSSVNEALKRGQHNIDKALDTLEKAVKMGLLSPSHTDKLKQICHKF